MSKIFNYFTSKIAGIKLHDFNCGLKAYRKEVIKSIKSRAIYDPAFPHLKWEK